MGMGSYSKGAEVRIPFQITDGGIPVSDASPVIEKIVKPSGSSESGFPRSMSAVDVALGTYEYSYSPKEIGDYIVIISVDIDGETYVSLENFTVKKATTSSSSGSESCSRAPRAEAR